MGGPPGVIRPGEREAFKRCRREWDFSARARGGYEPVPAQTGPDHGRALKDALAVYYFPGMWEWDRSIVRPLAREGFLRSTDDEEEMVRGVGVLDRYFEWASAVDDFVPIRVETDFDVPVPDPAAPDRDLATAAGHPVRYRGRADLVVVDVRDNYWIVEHRVTAGPWAAEHDLLLDERSTAAAWAWERFFLGMRIAGVVHNELRTDAAPESAAAAMPVAPPVAAGTARHRRMYAQGPGPSGDVTVQELPGMFRRTRVPLPAARLEAVGRQLAAEALDMLAPDVPVYPNPSPANCGRCDYRAPCRATALDADPADVLARSYRKREPEELVEGRLGGVTWAMGRGAAPPRFDD